MKSAVESMEKNMETWLKTLIEHDADQFQKLEKMEEEAERKADERFKKLSEIMAQTQNTFPYPYAQPIYSTSVQKPSMQIEYKKIFCQKRHIEDSRSEYKFIRQGCVF